VLCYINAFFAIFAEVVSKKVSVCCISISVMYFVCFKLLIQKQLTEQQQNDGHQLDKCQKHSDIAGQDISVQQELMQVAIGHLLLNVFVI